jgi:chemotaxis protein CheC
MTMSIPAVSDKQMNELRIIAAKGAENANLAFSRWLKEKARLEITDVSFVPFGDIVKNVGDSDRMVVSILLRMNGDVKGNAIFVFSEESAVYLIEKVSRNKVSKLSGLNTMNRSILEETGNIVGTAFLNSLVAHMDVSVSTSAPAFIHDYAEAILEMAVMEYAAVSDYALLFKTKFYEANTKIDGYFFILPSPESLSSLLEKIEGNEK